MNGRETAKREAPQGDEQLELFVAGFVDVAFRDQQDLMENPFCTLGKTPRKEPIRYQVGDKYVTVSANSETGIATIYDHDILIWAATQIREAADQGLPTGQRIVFHPYNLLKAIRRETGGREYELLYQALKRLQGTMVETNIRPDGIESEPKKRGRRSGVVTFSLLSGSGWVKDQVEGSEDDRMFFDLPLWFYSGILNHKLVLSIDPDYFLLSSGLERWLYRVFRKHAGLQENGWQFSMRQLHAKSGSSQRFSNFALEVRRVIERTTAENNLPGYSLSISRNQDGEEIVSGIARSRLGVSDPAYSFPANPRRRMGPHGMNPPALDNRPFARQLEAKGDKATKGRPKKR